MGKRLSLKPDTWCLCMLIMLTCVLRQNCVSFSASLFVSSRLSGTPFLAAIPVQTKITLVQTCDSVRYVRMLILIIQHRLFQTSAFCDESSLVNLIPSVNKYSAAQDSSRFVDLDITNYSYVFITNLLGDSNLRQD